MHQNIGNNGNVQMYSILSSDYEKMYILHHVMVNQYIVK